MDTELKAEKTGERITLWAEKQRNSPDGHAIGRFRLAEFNPPELDPYHSLEPDLVNCPAHRRLAQDAARHPFVEASPERIRS